MADERPPTVSDDRMEIGFERNQVTSNQKHRLMAFAGEDIEVGDWSSPAPHHHLQAHTYVSPLGVNSQVFPRIPFTAGGQLPLLKPTIVTLARAGNP